MTRVMLQVYPSLGNEEAMRARRPIGRDHQAVQEMLDGLTVVAHGARPDPMPEFGLDAGALAPG